MTSIEARQTEFLSIMKTPDGIPLVPLEMYDWLTANGFFDAPASTKFHGAHEGGLYMHSFAVTEALIDLTTRMDIRWRLPRSPYIVGMFHDLCKIDQYRHPASGLCANGTSVEDNSKWEYNTDTMLKGHGDKSVMLLSQFYNLTEEEILCIRYHMGAFVEKDEWRDYTRAVNRYATVLFTHTADMIAAHVKVV